MINAIKAIGKTCFLVLVLVAPGMAQHWLQTGPAPAATGPAYDLSVGYSNLTMAIPSAGLVNLNGLDVSGLVDVTPRWGAMVDANCVRTSNALGIPHDAYLLSFHAGPVFYPVERRNTRLFVHALAGVSRVAGAAPMTQNTQKDYFHGWVVRFSYAVGGGIERSVKGPFAVRLNGDYLHTAFFDYGGAVQPQNNLRVTVGFVLHLRGRQP